MTDSMKFGPEWLRNLATDMTNNQSSSGGGGGGSSSTSSASSTNSSNNGSSNNYQSGQLQQHAQLGSQFYVRNLFPEFRYGREEMLSLFDKNCSIPEILPSFKNLFIGKAQYPLALTPSTEEDPFSSVSQPPTQRPQWLQRSPVTFNSVSRGSSRGGSVDRGRMRGKSIYHPTYPRPTPMFDDDARNTKPERGWSERNGGPGENSSVGVLDWSTSPSSSPRKDFSGHPARIPENWRRSRPDEDAAPSSGTSGGGNANSGLIGITNSGGAAGGDGWRVSGSNNFGNNRWGRSASWREDDGGNGSVESNSYIIPPMQRSYSTIATTERSYFSLSKSSSLTSAVAGGCGGSSGGGGNNENINKPQTSSRHHHQNSGNHLWDTDDILPEWAMENPTDSGGTFDATGAFHGSVDEHEEKLRGGSGRSSTTSSTPSSNTKTQHVSTEQCENTQRGEKRIAFKGEEELPVEKIKMSLNNEDLINEDERCKSKRQHPQASVPLADLGKTYEDDSSFVNDLKANDEQLPNATSMNSSSPSYLATSPKSTSTSASSMTSMPQPSLKIPILELSDRMQEVADDMVEKLIMDDDNVAQSGQKSSTAGAVASSATSIPVVAGKHPTAVANIPLQGVPIAAKVAAIFKNQPNKGVFLPAVDPILQQHIQQQAAAVAAIGSGVPPPGTRMLPPSIPKQNELWYYRDPQSKVQGPFTAMEMIEWYRAGYFDENLYVRRMCDSRFAALGELIKMCGQMPFQSSHLIPPLQSTEIPSMASPIPIPIPQHESGHQVSDVPGSGIVNSSNICIGDLKGSVTATADALGAALKNVMSPVDVSHLLSAHFQMLQEQYLRHQEMLVLAEFSVKDSFNRLTPNEKAALVRQKVHIMGLPEHLTSLAGLSHSLASVNPTAGNHLCDVIAECCKKEPYGMSLLETQLQQFQQHLQHHHQQKQQQQQVLHQHTQQVQQQSQNSFAKPEDFRQQHQQQINQQASIYQGAPYRSLFSQVDAAGGTAPGEDNLNSDILNELGMQMMLRQSRLRTGREQASLLPQMAAAQNDFGPELLSRATPQVLAATVVNMIPQWSPHILPQMLQQPTSQQNVQVPATAPNKWPLISAPVPVTQMQPTVPKLPSAMWAAADSSTQLLMAQECSVQTKVDGNFVSRQFLPHTQPQHQAQSQQQIRRQDTNINNVEKAMEEIIETTAITDNNNTPILTTNSSMATTETASAQSTLVNSSNRTKNEKFMLIEDNLTSPHISTKPSGSNITTTNSGNNVTTLHVHVNVNNKRNGKQKPTDKPSEAPKNKAQQQQQQTQPIAGPTEEERRKEAAEEKRKQKEEKKRQQQEDEKKRLQLAEEEKRRQAFAEKERQKDIQTHRRKAMLNSANGGYSAVMGSNANNLFSGKLTNSASGNTLSKQERMQTSIAPWSTNTKAAVASAPGPSLAEIQKAERRERRADQRLMEQTEKRMAAAAEATDSVLKWNAAPVQVKSLAEIQAEEAKRLATEQASNTEMQRRKEQEQTTSVSTNSLSSNPFAMIWSGSKVWGTNNSTSGFWEESVKLSNSAGATSSTSSSTAAKAGSQNYGTSGNNTITISKQSASSLSSGNGLSSASPGGRRNLTKMQNLSNMVGVSGWDNVNLTYNSAQPKSMQHVSSLKQQPGGNAFENNVSNTNKGKRVGKSIAKTSNTVNCPLPNPIPTASVTTNNVNKIDEFRNEFTGWCMKSLNSMNPKVDVPTFVTFLQDLESPYEVKDYVRMYLGESKEYAEFAKQFLERRSKYKNLQRAQNAHIDDMCKPAPAINPSGNDSFDNKGKQKKVKKSKMTRLDARILGFSVTAAEGRINVGDRDYGDAP